MAFDPISEDTERYGKIALDACFRVHSELGPGLLERVYEECLCYELSQAGIKFERQISLPLRYREIRIATGLTLDVYVEQQVILELKAVEASTPLHKAQLMTYMKLSDTRLGFIVNFNVVHLKDGIRRVVL